MTLSKFFLQDRKRSIKKDHQIRPTSFLSCLTPTAPRALVSGRLSPVSCFSYEVRMADVLHTYFIRYVISHSLSF